MSCEAPNYPFIVLLTRYGQLAAMLVGVVPALLALLWSAAGPLPAAIAAVPVASVARYVSVRTLVELLQVMTDMLLPR